MSTQPEPIPIQDDPMISIYLSNGVYEVNEELIPEVNKAVSALGLMYMEGLKTITEEQFFPIFTPLMNERYGLTE